MSIFIHSEDYTSGTSSDGVWDLNRNLQGVWKVTGQSMDSQSYPWLFDGQNKMVMRIHDPMNALVYTTFEIEFDASIGLLDDPATIATQMTTAMQDRIDEIALIDPYAARTVTSGVDTVAKTIVFNFDVDPVSVMWEGAAPLESTINPSLDKVGASNELNILDLTISYIKMTTSPKYLFVYIDECSSDLITTSGNAPNLIFSAQDSPFLGQTINIRGTGTNLTIKICRLHETEAVPLTGEWYLILERIG